MTLRWEWGGSMANAWEAVGETPAVAEAASPGRTRFGYAPSDSGGIEG